MKTGARDSQIVNNFFTFASIVIITITIVLYNHFINKETNTSPKIEKLPCELENYTKVSLLDFELLKKSKKALDKGYYKVEGFFLNPENDTSSIENVVSVDEIKNYYKTLIGVKPKKDIEKFLKIRFELIEKDKKNINSDRLGAGTLISSFRVNSKELLRFESDFKFIYKNAIKQRVDCSMKVYKKYVEH